MAAVICGISKLAVADQLDATKLKYAWVTAVHSRRHTQASTKQNLMFGPMLGIRFQHAQQRRQNHIADGEAIAERVMSLDTVTELRYGFHNWTNYKLKR